MGQRARAPILSLIVLGCALGGAVRARADVTTLDAFAVPLRAGEFARLEDQLARVAREKTRDENGAPLLAQIPDRLAAALLSDETLTPLLDRWAEAAPRSRFEPLVRAHVELRLAWRERGGGFAGSVPPSAWPRWHAHLDRADAALAVAAKRAPELAEAPAERVWVALLRERPSAEIRANFDAALRIDPTHELAHRNLLNTLTERWGGSDEAMLAFARLTAKQHPDDARLGLLVHYAHLDIVSRLPESEARLYYRDPAVWAEISHALARLQQAYPESLWAHNSLAYIASKAGQREVALHEFRWILWRWDPVVWHNDLGEFISVRAWVRSTTRTSPPASRP